MSNLIPIVPTLQSGIGILTNIEETVSYLIRHVLANPGKAHQVTEEEMRSIRQIAMTYDKEPERLCGALEEALKSRLRYLSVTPGNDIQITCTAQYRQEDPAVYDIKLRVSGSYINENGNSVPFNIGELFEINENKTLSLKLKGSSYV